MALSTSLFQPSKTTSELLASRTLREYISVILRYQLCGNLLHQPQETNTQVYKSSKIHAPNL